MKFERSEKNSLMSLFFKEIENRKYKLYGAFLFYSSYGRSYPQGNGRICWGKPRWNLGENSWQPAGHITGFQRRGPVELFPSGWSRGWHTYSPLRILEVRLYLCSCTFTEIVHQQQKLFTSAIQGVQSLWCVGFFLSSLCLSLFICDLISPRAFVSISKPQQSFQSGPI